jgi:hypothetical protein
MASAEARLQHIVKKRRDDGREIGGASPREEGERLFLGAPPRARRLPVEHAAVQRAAKLRGSSTPARA